MFPPSRRGGGRELAAWLAVAALVAVALAVAATAAPSGIAGHAAAAGATGTVASSQGSGITDTNLSGAGVATRQDNTTYVWKDGHTVFRTTVFPLNGSGTHDVCLGLLEGNETVRHHGCQETDVKSYGTRATFDLQELGANGTGDHEFVVLLQRGDQHDSARLPITVVERDGDLDGDDLSNEDEIANGTEIANKDTDNDTLMDGLELTNYECSPTSADTDGDGLRDPAEEQEGTDCRNPDTDGDGLSDKEEVDRGTDPTTRDSDGDGLSDPEEVNEYDTDPLDPDTDGDGISDGQEIDQGTDPLESETPGGARGPIEALGGLTGRFAPVVYGLGLLLLVGVAAAAYTRYEEGWGAPGSGSVGGPGNGVGTDGGAAESGGVTDPELLSPEQHVHQLLEINGGQMRQSDIVEQTDWSKAKVSRTLSSMEDDDAIKRVRIGRGNVVTYPGTDPGEER